MVITLYLADSFRCARSGRLQGLFELLKVAFVEPLGMTGLRRRLSSNIPEKIGRNMLLAARCGIHGIGIPPHQMLEPHVPPDERRCITRSKRQLVEGILQVATSP